MSVTIHKVVSVQIDGSDVDDLKDVCELARRYIASRKRAVAGAAMMDEHYSKSPPQLVTRMEPVSLPHGCDEYPQDTVIRLTNLMGKLFDNG